MCLSPITLKNQGVTAYKTGKHMTVPCGSCLECLQVRRAGWSLRLQQELNEATQSDFLTLTYNDENLPLAVDQDTGEIVPVFKKKDLQDYFKRVRKECKNLKYYAVGEYGTDNERPHMHAIVFNADIWTLTDKWANSEGPLGRTDHGEVTDESIHYVTGYIVNNTSQKSLKPFALMSKGLGKIYLKHATKFHKSNLTNIGTSRGGVKYIIPRYYADRIFSTTQKDKIRKKSIEYLAKRDAEKSIKTRYAEIALLKHSNNLSKKSKKL